MRRQQKGHVFISRGSWAIRWRENVIDATGKTERVRRFKLLGEVLPEHKRNKHRIPPEVQSLADDAIKESAGTATVSVLPTIQELFDQFIEYKKDLKPSSVAGYRRLWKRYLLNRIGHLRVRDFRRADATRLWEQIVAGNPGLGKRTIQNVRFFVSGLFEFAKDRGIFSSGIDNPAEANIPQGLHVGEGRGAYSLAECVRILKLMTLPRDEAIIALFTATGMRSGELSALMWEDYTPQPDGGAILRVERSNWERHITAPKTKSSKRTYHVHPIFCQYIEAYRKFLGGVDSGFMFGYSHDRPINLQSFWKWTLRPVLNRCAVCRKHKGIHKKADHEFQRDAMLPQWRGYHGFRKSLATWMAEHEGADMAAAFLGHAGTEVTETHYIEDSRQLRLVREQKKVIRMSKEKKRASIAFGDAVAQAVN